LADFLKSPFPTSIIDAMARGDVLQIVVFALLFGFACAAIGAAAEPVVRVCESLAEVMFRYTHYVMYAAPLGIFGAVASSVGSRGPSVLFSLGALILTLYAALLVFVLLVLGLLAQIIRLPLGRFFVLVREPFMIAFSTTSSNVALPLALEKMEKFGIPRHIAAFALPASMSFNTTGSCLFLSLAVVFCAQVAGVMPSFGTVVLMVLTLMLTSKGIGAVPRGSLVILAGTLTSFGLPLEGVALILGVDQLMDMARTGVNMLGHCLATAAIARWEGVDLKATEAGS
jgi:proton glutamate symport protein